MKKIHCNKQLQAQKKRIKLRREELGKKIYTNWNELKDAVNPFNYAKETFNKVIYQQTADNLNDQSVLKNSFTFGVMLLAKKMADKAEIQIARFFKK